MKEPHLTGDAFLADVADALRSAPAEPAQSLHLWWLGQSGFLVACNGKRLLLDPYLSDSLTRKYAATDKPHVRMTERVVAPEQLDFIDLVTSSHIHTDHLDPETLKPLAQVNPRLVMVCAEANRAMVRDRSGLPDHRILGIDLRLNPASAGPIASAEAMVDGIRFRAVPAAHEELACDAAGRLLHIGMVIELGLFRVYHSGDTVRYPGMAERLAPLEVDIALLPINGRSPERRVAGNLNGPEAAQLAKDIRARMVIPCHYDMFEFNTASPDEFMKECTRLHQPFRVLRQGERGTWNAARPS
jgi:L-ascorbate metabolism protein UlaG (beta-lactamase superfamily)